MRPDYVAIFRFHGPFLFGTTDKLDPIIDGIAALPPIVILRLRNMTAIDATGLGAIEDLANRLKDGGRTLIRVRGPHPALPADVPGRVPRAGRGGNICHSVQEALDRARALQAP